MKWQSPPIRQAEPRKGTPLSVPRTGTRPRAPKVFSTSKGMSMEQTSPPSLRLTSARKRLTGDFAADFFADFFAAVCSAVFFVAIPLSSEEDFTNGLPPLLTRAALPDPTGRTRARAAPGRRARAGRPRARATAR